MSRIGATPISIPTSVSVTQTPEQVLVKGGRGEMVLKLPKNVSIQVEEQKLTVKRLRDTQQARANHGLVRSLLFNMITGVDQGFVKKLELVGTGYRAKIQGKDLILTLGFSHPITYTPPEKINISTEGDTIVVISGIDSQQVGQAAADIRAYRPPEPYKGKGVRYQGEIIRRKAGKAAKVGSAG